MEDRILLTGIGDQVTQARLIYGLDCLGGLLLLPDKSVHMVATSPPYWGLRSYPVDNPTIWADGWEGQLGLEPTPEAYVRHMVEVFQGVRRVLRDDGTIWLNLGDSYAGSGGYFPDAPVNQDRVAGTIDGTFKVPAPETRGARLNNQARQTTPGVKDKDLVGIPWMVAFALRVDGWYLRTDIIWSKPHCMPESVQDRPTRAHEYVFLLSKSPRYFYDIDAIREPHAFNRWGDRRLKEATIVEAAYEGQSGTTSFHRKGEHNFHPNGGRNKRTVWHIDPQSYQGSHFAVWPKKLVEPMVKAGTSEKGCCRTCGAPWRDGPTCTCPVRDPFPCTVLDPFSGSATTGLVANNLGRNYIGLDASSEYLDLAVARLEDRPPPQRGTGTEGDDDLFDLFSDDPTE